MEERKTTAISLILAHIPMRFAVSLVCLFMVAGLFATRTVHVIVALADNQNLGSIKVPAAFGNGQMPASNLYWGAGHGVRTHFDWAQEWIKMPSPKPATAHILERAVWKHRDSAIYLIADAYDGRNLREATEDLLLYASGGRLDTVKVDGKEILAGGAADLVVYIGHNGLMDHKIEKAYRPAEHRNAEVIILASLSRGFFSNPVRATTAKPLLWTTGLINPEAYILRDALLGWVARETDEQIRERAAKAIDQYQKIGIANARRLLVTGW